MWRTCFLFCSALLWGPSLLFAQPCGLTDTLGIALNSSPTYTYQVVDIFNDDLSAADQGICGVEIRFAHQYVDNLVLTLTAPNGQAVTLIGPNTDQQFEFTFGSIWDISFVPCLETPDPDPGSLFGWDNNQTGNFSNLNLYTGSYYPYQGCLEDFNAGPANGTWTLNIGNTPSDYIGEITYFRIEFCDARGIDCCFAQGGNLFAQDILTCEGDSTLDIDPLLAFDDGQTPDTAIYGYTYLLGQDGILLDTTDQPDLTGFAPGSYQICGLGYHLEDADSIPMPDGTLTLDSIRNNLDGLEPRFCGALSDSCIQVTILPLPATELLEETLCLGDSLIVGDTILKNTGFYEIELMSYAGCDSLVQVDLTVLPPLEVNLVDTLCPGQFIQVGGNIYNMTGTYRDTITSAAGCDSIVTLDLTVPPPNIVDTTVTICQGESFAVRDSLLTEAGFYSFFLTSALNCDSTLNITLEVLEPIASIAPAFNLTCITSSVELNGTGSTPAGQLSYQWYAPDGTTLGTAPTQTVAQAGAFVLEVRQVSTDMTTCTTFDTLVVEIDTIPPVSDAGPQDTLNCTQGQVELGGITTPDPNYTYFWYTPDGNIVSDVFQPTAVANDPGSYFLVVTDIDNRCSDTSMTTVLEDQDLPSVEPGTDTLLSCLFPEITLDGSGSSEGPNFAYEWSDEAGNLLQDGTTLFPVVSQGGTYQLMVENTLTNCRDSATVMVGYDTIAPRVNLPIPDILTCTQPTVSFSGSVVGAGPAPVYAWSSTEGNILTDPNALTITVDQSGVYTLIAENSLNGCQGTANTTVIEDITVVNAVLPAPDTLSCAQPNLTLMGTGSSSGPNITYTWSGNPQAPASTDGFNANVDAPGAYQLIVTDTTNSCADTAVVTVALDTLQPLATAGPDRTLTCDSTTVLLDGSGSSLGIQFDYDWVEIVGTGLVDTNTLQATVGSPGVYMLVVTNTQNGCFDTAFAVVNIDTLSPGAALAAPLRLNCTVAEVPLDGSNSDTGPGFSFSWSTTGNGSFVSGTNTLMPTVNAAGIYQLEVENDSTGCTQTTQIQVFQDTLPPVANAGPDTLINCLQPTVLLGSSNTSQGPEIVYNWSGPNGGITGPANERFAVANAPGTYIIHVRNTTTGCEATDTVGVTGNFNFPDAIAGADQELDCALQQVMLSATGSTIENTVFNWSGPCLSGDPAGQDITATCDGIYILSVTDSLNGCTATDTVTVTRDPLSPNAILPDTIVLSCTEGTALLDATASEGTTFDWFFNDSPITPAGLSFTIDSAGIYTLIANNTAGDCPDTASVAATFDCSPGLVIAAPDTLTCTVQDIMLDATGSESGPNIVYTWIPPNAGCIESGETTLQPIVRCPGTYQFIATNTTFNLSDTLTVVVPSNTIAPIAEAGAGDTLTCPEPTTILSAAGSSSGPGIGYTWTKLDDETFVRDSFSIFVNDASTYFLTVLDSTNGCFAEDIVVVQRSDNLPDLNFSSTIIPCMQDSFWLQAFVVPQGPQYVYAWEGNVILDGADSVTVLLDTAGTVRLTVTNPANNCSSFRDVLVTQQECVPCLDSIPTDTLTCNVLQVALSGSFCEPCIGCTVNWTTTEGNILSDPDSLEIVVNQPGLYTLNATDTLGFSAKVTVTVTELATPPDLTAGPDQVLNCRDTSVVLTTSTLPGADLAFQWSTTDGATPAEDTLTSITVTQAGLYTIVATDRFTGCEAIDEVLVEADTFPPLTDAGPTQVLNCNTPTVTLDGSGSAFGNAILYAWSGPVANIPGSTTFNPSVNTAGWYELMVTDTTTGCTNVDSVLVTQNTDLPAIPSIPDTVITCGSPSVVLQGSLPGDTGYSSCWYRLNENGDPTGPCVPTLSIDVSLPGLYGFEVQNDTSGCTSTVTVEVTQDTLSPTLELADTLLFPCATDSLNITATGNPQGNLIYQWSSLGGFPIQQADQATATVFQPGVYQVQVERTDNGCSVMGTVSVEADDRIPVVTAGPDTLITCNNNPIRLSASAITDSGMSDLLWTTEAGQIISGQATATPQIGAAGWYLISVTDPESGCSAVDSTFVADGQIAPEAGLSNPDLLTLNCAMDSLLMDGTATTGGTGAGYNYQWRRGAFNTIGTAPQQWISEVGSYRLIVQDQGSGCLDTLVFQINGDFSAPSVEVVPPSRLNCNRTTVLLDGSGSETGPGLMYTWQDSSGIVIAQDSTSIEVSMPGPYTLLVTDTTNGCSSSETVIVDSDANFPEIVIAAPAELSCSQTSITLNATASSGEGPLLFNWSAGAGAAIEGPTDQPTTMVTAEGWYVLTLTDQSNGCALTDSVEVTASSPLIDTVNWQTESPACPGDRNGSIALDAVAGGTPPFVSAINGGALSMDNAFVNLTAGSYPILLEDANGCQWSSIVNIAASSGIDIELGPDTTIQLGQQITLSAMTLSGVADSIWWWPSPGIQEGADYTVAPTLTTLYQVWAQDGNGCQDQAQVTVKVTKDTPVYAPTVFSPNGDNNNDRFVLYSREDLGTLTVFRIFDRWGNLVHEVRECALNDENCGWDGTFRGSEMDSDVFTFYAEINLASGGTTIISGDVLLLR
ncbi:MAG: T9SS type B sorting domain-containing protein [Phaeodactylibacter sp.]|uniref:T9SS type B sorting domain-containing protein n=1 Tax=Phaeodactylibacter sp. TaxID=1940289 RepID=UPI0032EF96DE